MKLLAIDGNSIMNRAFYGIKALSTSKGEYTNALTGFMNIYLKEVEEIKPDCVAVAFDLKALTFRHKADESYKANRKGMPEELAQQMPIIKEMLGYMGISTVECEGWEADDILGTLSKIFGEPDECYILTGDRDSLQLITESCTVRLATNRSTINYTTDKFREDYGFEPINLIDLKALMGDSSDNISGVKGIGEKTASALICECGTIEDMYNKLDSLKLTPSVRTKLTNGKADAERSKFLATIVTDAPIDRERDHYLIGKRDEDALKMLLVRLEMNKLMQRLGLTGAQSARAKSSSARSDKSDILDSLSDSDASAKAVSGEQLPTCELTDGDVEKLGSSGASCAFTFDGTKLCAETDGAVRFTEDERLILKFLTSGAEKRCFEGRHAHLFAFAHGARVEGLTFCCDLAGYLLNSQASGYTAENLCLTYGAPYCPQMGEYADAAAINGLADVLTRELETAGMMQLFNDIEMPLCEVLASMEHYGVQADSDGIRHFGEKLNRQLSQLTAEIFELAGSEFNISSPKQLGKVLFEDLALPAKKKTKSGYSTNAEVLETLVDKHPIVPLILEYRTLSKLSSTYVDGLLKQVHPDGRVHSFFKQTETRTGRISSTEPNMQNIPVRKPIGREMRRFFTASDGCLLVDADYSQIELRVLASVCGDENMRDAFISGRDIHTSTAAQVFRLPEDMITSDLRSKAKAVNFGIIYGIGAFSLSKDIGVSVAEGKKYIENYLANFPKVSEFMDNTVSSAMRDGYVTTVFGRRRYIPELSAKSKVLQAFGKRAAMNAPIQGAAADIIKLAMVRVYKRLAEELPQARLILQVHDELIIEVPEEQAAAAEKLLKEEMEAAAQMSVPMTVDVHSGKSWYDAKG